MDLNRPRKELIHTLVDKIVIDKNRIIMIKYRYGVMTDCTFKYHNLNLACNFYDRKEKSQCKNLFITINLVIFNGKFGVFHFWVYNEFNQRKG